MNFTRYVDCKCVCACAVVNLIGHVWDPVRDCSILGGPWRIQRVDEYFVWIPLS